MSRVPFSHLTPPKTNKPFAIGESGYHLPAIPFMSGQEAIDSLTGYYPTRRMDSILDPRTYQRPNYLRATTMPGTKAALLRDAAKAQYAQDLIGRLTPRNSDLVQGFLIKCAEAGLQAPQIVDVIQRAMHIHPVVAIEFTKCGMIKLALGEGLTPPASPMGGIKPPAAAPTMAPPATAPSLAAPKPPTPTSAPTMAPTPPAATAAPPTAPVPPKEPNLLAQGLHGAWNTTSGGATALGGGLGTLAGGIGSLGARATDGLGLTKNWTDPADAFTKTMANATQSGVATGWAGLTGQKPADVAGQMNAGPYQGVTSVPQMMQNHISQLHEGGGVELPGGYKISPEASGGAYNALMNTGHGAAAAVPMVGGAQMAAGVPGIGGTVKSLAGGALPAAAMMGTPLEAMYGAGLTAGQGDYSTPGEFMNKTFNRMPSYAQGTQPPEQQSTPPGETPQPGQLGQPDPTVAAGVQNTKPVSPVTEPTMMENMQNFLQKAPEQAMQYGKQAMGQLKGILGSSEGQAEADSVLKNGQLSSTGQQQAQTALTKDGYNWQQAGDTLSKMSPWEQLGLYGGLGVSALGLLHVLSGGGGLGSLMMSLLGLGAAGFTAAKTGLLDQGSKDWATGMQNSASGAVNSMMGKPNQAQPGKPPVPGQAGQPQAFNMQAMKSVLPTLIDHASPESMMPLMAEAAKNPEIAQQLDGAAGTGSGFTGLWNAGKSFIGDNMGWRQQLMQQKLGLNPAQQDKLLKHWTNYRSQHPQ